MISGFFSYYINIYIFLNNKLEIYKQNNSTYYRSFMFFD